MTALKRMGNDFLKGYCNLLESEKDPRNLKLIFAIDQVILTEFDLLDRVEVGVSFSIYLDYIN